MIGKMCYSSSPAGGYVVKLIQTGIDRFTVEYGKEIKADLRYGPAATALGSAIMHALACEGGLDNREEDDESI